MLKLFRLWTKRKWKLQRRLPLRLACIAAGAALLLAGYPPELAAASPVASVPAAASAPAEHGARAKESDDGAAAFLRDREAAPVVLRKVYLCGVETQPLGRLEAEEVHRLLLEQPRLTATVEGGEVLLTETVDDLSASCRQSATFGVDAGGSLTLFEGPPKEEKVIKTFYQLDLQHMESSLPKEELDRLFGGIRVQDKDEYNSVISSYGDFAVDASRGAMKHTY
ncbi:hypothetical protein HGI30_15745 [Paenibacillus albicereus]|uniref:Bypass of forespore C C-terminal domain-containing protein n=1 Tax=Paenibacillus albicereus TaxID=2726185 RepID=A0A6H2GZL1_9BACL|nr:BofC C-terminal domain-containing protein [Paenibacillus albicereus]QJC52874.1 hypothetical protein HGI30_15745 [Paenibacillus albicereus]